MNQKLEQPLCRSIFKSGKSETTREAYTQAWITLINQTEKNKSSNLGAKNDK